VEKPDLSDIRMMMTHTRCCTASQML